MLMFIPMERQQRMMETTSGNVLLALAALVQLIVLFVPLLVLEAINWAWDVTGLSRVEPPRKRKKS